MCVACNLWCLRCHWICQYRNWSHVWLTKAPINLNENAVYEKGAKVCALPAPGSPWIKGRNTERSIKKYLRCRTSSVWQTNVRHGKSVAENVRNILSSRSFEQRKQILTIFFNKERVENKHVFFDNDYVMIDNLWCSQRWNTASVHPGTRICSTWCEGHVIVNDVKKMLLTCPEFDQVTHPPRICL